MSLMHVMAILIKKATMMQKTQNLCCRGSSRSSAEIKFLLTWFSCKWEFLSIWHLQIGPCLFGEAGYVIWLNQSVLSVKSIPQRHPHSIVVDTLLPLAVSLTFFIYITTGETCWYKILSRSLLKCLCLFILEMLLSSKILYGHDLSWFLDPLLLLTSKSTHMSQNQYSQY